MCMKDVRWLKWYGQNKRSDKKLLTATVKKKFPNRGKMKNCIQPKIYDIYDLTTARRFDS